MSSAKKPGTVVTGLSPVVARGDPLPWGDELPRNPANALQIQISYLRKTLGAGARDGAALLETRAGGYALLVQPDQIDSQRFEAATRTFTRPTDLSSEADVRHALEAVERALPLAGRGKLHGAA